MQRPSVDLPQPDSPTKPEHLARLHREVDACHRLHHVGRVAPDPAPDRIGHHELHLQPAHLEQRLRHL